jgi:3-hydroxybutyrate dehydrogenase
VPETKNSFDWEGRGVSGTEVQPMSVDLEGRSAVVTGAASGIGEACARRLAGAGARVTVLDLDGEGAERVAGQLGGTAVAVDLTDPGGLDGLDLAADVLVNNAGFQHVAPVEEFPPERFTAMLALMVEAPFRLARAVLPGMYERGWGRVVNISSVHGLRASPYKSAYVAAKHGLLGLVKVLALEGAEHGISATAVCPGYVRTPLVEAQIAAQAEAHGLPEERVLDEVILAPHAVKRLIEPAEVAAVVAFLLGDDGRSFTGAPVTMDQGWTAR